MTDPTGRRAELRTVAERVETAVKLATALAGESSAAPDLLLLLKVLNDAQRVLERLVRDEVPVEGERGT
jgi:hypothetical protein